MSYNIATSLDPEEIKESLKEFLKTQDEFTSYDFEGTGMSTLLDILAQNTYYTSFLANMLSSEVTIDTSQIRSVVTSHAKRLSYTPQSKVSSTAYVDIVVTPTGSPPASLTLNKYTKFSGNIDEEVFFFVNTDTYIAPLVDGVYTFKNVKLYQGKILSMSYTADGSETSFEVPNKEVDINNMFVNVQNSVSDSVVYNFARSDTLIDVDATTPVFFVSENMNEKYEISFGDGVIGKPIISGNIINIEYLSTKGQEANGCNVFFPISSIGNYNNISVTTTQKSFGGRERESIESIKFHAPKKFYSQNRAVISQDYIPIVKGIIPQAKDVKVWGGETNVPPQYGTVFIALKMDDNTILTDTVKTSIANTQLKKFMVTSITPIIVDAEVIKLKVGLSSIYSSSTLNIKESELIANIKSEVVKYSENNLELFDSRFRASKLLRQIDDSNASIKNTFITSLDLYKEITVDEGITQSLNIQFGDNVIEKGSFYVDGFRVVDTTTNQNLGPIYYMKDDGNGVVNVYRSNDGTEVKVIGSIGTVDYDGATIKISNFTPIESTNKLNFKVSPDNQDIEVVRGEILEISNVADVDVSVVQD